MPIRDWQFWVATGLALLAAWYVLHHLLPIPFPFKRRRRGRKVTLTVGGRNVRR